MVQYKDPDLVLEGFRTFLFVVLQLQKKTVYSYVTVISRLMEACQVGCFLDIYVY